MKKLLTKYKRSRCSKEHIYSNWEFKRTYPNPEQFVQKNKQENIQSLPEICRLENISNLFAAQDCDIYSNPWDFFDSEDSHYACVTNN